MVINFLLLPILFLVAVVILFVMRKRRGVGLAVVFFATTLAAGLWAIMQSRSSTAGIGVLFLPMVAVLPGFLAWAFRNLQVSGNAGLRILGWLCLAGACAVLGAMVYEGGKTIQLNQTRDAQQAARSLRIDENRKTIAAMLRETKGREAAALDQLIQEKSKDDEFLLPALASEFVPADTLDRFARADDFSVTLTVLRNPNCRAETLARIYRTHTTPSYFHQALAAHPNTPVDILRELFNKPRDITGLDIWFGKNPSTPADILLELANTQDLNVIQSLLQNPRLDCTMLGRIEGGIKRSTRPDDSYSTSRIVELRRSMCAPRQAAGDGFTGPSSFCKGRGAWM
jgi:hypothetical protein